jgi:hypothetical protein
MNYGCLSLLLFGFSTLAQAPADVHGWGKIAWGMPLADAQAAYPEAVQAEDAWCSRLELPAIDIAGIPMHVAISARKPSAQVSLVVLWNYFGLPDQTGAAARVTPRDFETLKTLMIQKYGLPKDRQREFDRGDPVQVLLWTFPSTSIRLRFRESHVVPGLGDFHVEYRPTDRAARDNL